MTHPEQPVEFESDTMTPRRVIMASSAALEDGGQEVPETASFEQKKVVHPSQNCISSLPLSRALKSVTSPTQ
jgi:hypothetical protein